MYLLDTNIISYWMRGDADVIRRVKRHSPAELAMTSISLAEILYGIEKSPIKKTERTRKIEKISSSLDIYPFDESAAPHYAVIRANLERKGRIISERDMQIAAIAKAAGAILVTNNTGEFNRVAKLKIENWVDG
jgi:tRNA(fMet)-specific endonuclease VapC